MKGEPVTGPPVVVPGSLLPRLSRSSYRAVLSERLGVKRTEPLRMVRYEDTTKMLKARRNRDSIATLRDREKKH